MVVTATPSSEQTDTEQALVEKCLIRKKRWKVRFALEGSRITGEELLYLL